MRVVLLNSPRFTSAGVENQTKFAVRLVQFYLGQLLRSLGRGRKTFSLDNDREALDLTRFSATVQRDFELKFCEDDLNDDDDSKKIWRDLARGLVRADGRRADLKYLALGNVAAGRGERRQGGIRHAAIWKFLLYKCDCSMTMWVCQSVRRTFV